MRNLLKVACLFVILSLSWRGEGAAAQEILGNRSIKLTLIPDYTSHTIHFDGWLDLHDPAKPLDLEGLPLHVERQWRAEGSSIWNITGSIREGKVLSEAESKSYHLIFGPIQLQPNDRLSLILPFVNLDYAQLQPPADELDEADAISRQRTHLFTYSTGDAGREIPALDISFTPVVMKADLRLVPLMGEALVGKSTSVQFYGNVQFENITDFDEFSRYCQTTAERIQYGDYRAGHLIYNLDFPAHFPPDVLNPIYAIKPTRVALRTDLSACEYDKEKGVGQVQATFSGRMVSISQEARSFPPELEGRGFSDGNYSFVPAPGFKGVRGYQIVLGKILLVPGDVLTITIPNTQVQVDGLQPSPGGYENTGDQRIVYAGPGSFQLSVPYTPQSSLYLRQFPSILRLSLSAIEKGLGSFYPLRGSYETWLFLALGLVLYFLSGFRPNAPNVSRLAALGWLLITLSFFYGVRGAFGLFCVAIPFYLTRRESPGSTDRREGPGKILRGLAAFALVGLGVYFDSKGANFFRGLSGPELSPLTPVVHMILTGLLFFVLYRGPVKAESFTRSDLPILIVFLTVPVLYDALDKSMLALLILFTGGWYILRSARSPGEGTAQNEEPFGTGLQRRWDLALGNRIVPLAILILMVFATLNNLSSTYSSDLHVLLPPFIAPLVVPLLSAISVFITFSSIAWLFILIFPFLPFRTGYLKAAVFSLFLFLVFLFGIGANTRLIDSLSNLLIGRFIYYVSVPMLIGIYLDIHEFMQQENERLSPEGEGNKRLTLREASSQYFKNLQGIMSTLAGIASLVAPTIYTFLSGQPAMITYFDLLEKLVSLQN